jgi:hypothetical protein
MLQDTKVKRKTQKAEGKLVGRIRNQDGAKASTSDYIDVVDVRLMSARDLFSVPIVWGGGGRRRGGEREGGCIVERKSWPADP